jgi:hypothetical protein
MEAVLPWQALIELIVPQDQQEGWPSAISTDDEAGHPLAATVVLAQLPGYGRGPD